MELTDKELDAVRELNGWLEPNQGALSGFFGNDFLNNFGRALRIMGDPSTLPVDLLAAHQEVSDGLSAIYGELALQRNPRAAALLESFKGVNSHYRAATFDRQVEAPTSLRAFQSWMLNPQPRSKGGVSIDSGSTILASSSDQTGGGIRRSAAGVLALVEAVLENPTSLAANRALRDKGSVLLGGMEVALGKSGFTRGKYPALDGLWSAIDAMRNAGVVRESNDLTQEEQRVAGDVKAATDPQWKYLEERVVAQGAVIAELRASVSKLTERVGHLGAALEQVLVPPPSTREARAARMAWERDLTQVNRAEF